MALTTSPALFGRRVLPSLTCRGFAAPVGTIYKLGESIRGISVGIRLFFACFCVQTGKKGMEGEREKERGEREREGRNPHKPSQNTEVKRG
eukprot:431748-Amorphochlora_amoeboformis.AAC.1